MTKMGHFRKSQGHVPFEALCIVEFSPSTGSCEYRSHASSRVELNREYLLVFNIPTTDQFMKACKIKFE